MMEIRILDGKPFIVTRKGKHELVSTPEAVTAAQQAYIASASAALNALRHREQAAQQTLEAAVFAGASSAPARLDLAAVLEEIQGFERDITHARSAIAQVSALIEFHAANRIRQADATAVAELIQPFTDFLKDHK